MTDGTTYERLKKIIVEQLGVDEEEVTPTASFVEDLNADSLDLVELIMSLEEEFGTGRLLFAWVVVDEPFSASFYRAMAVLVAASPCALAIATPASAAQRETRIPESAIAVAAQLRELTERSGVAFIMEEAARA